VGHGARGVARLLEVDGQLRGDLPGAVAVAALQTLAEVIAKSTISLFGRGIEAEVQPRAY